MFGEVVIVYVPAENVCVNLYFWFAAGIVADQAFGPDALDATATGKTFEAINYS